MRPAIRRAGRQTVRPLLFETRVLIAFRMVFLLDSPSGVLPLRMDGVLPLLFSLVHLDREGDSGFPIKMPHDGGRNRLNDSAIQNRAKRPAGDRSEYARSNIKVMDDQAYHECGDDQERNEWIVDSVQPPEERALLWLRLKGRTNRGSSGICGGAGFLGRECSSL